MTIIIAPTERYTLLSSPSACFFNPVNSFLSAFFSSGDRFDCFLQTAHWQLLTEISYSDNWNLIGNA